MDGRGLNNSPSVPKIAGEHMEKVSKIKQEDVGIWDSKRTHNLSVIEEKTGRKKKSKGSNSL